MGIFDIFKKARLSDEIIIAADMGDEEATAKLSYEFERGLTSDEHNRLRKKAYHPLAVRGDANAQYWMGFLSLHIDKDVRAAHAWYENAAAKGNTEAMRDLALGYSEFVNDPANGSIGCIGFGFDLDKERYWKLKAAEHGDHKAQVDLGLDYKIDGDIENSLKMYKSATASSECKVLMEAYKGLAEIYGNSLDAKNYNVELQRNYLFRILNMKQNNLQDLGAYDETAYTSAACSLSMIYLNEYKLTKNPLSLKRYKYCFALASYYNEYLEEDAVALAAYKTPASELSLWQNDARTLSFHLPQ